MWDCWELWQVRILNRKTKAESNGKKLGIRWSNLLIEFFKCLFLVCFFNHRAVKFNQIPSNNLSQTSFAVFRSVSVPFVSTRKYLIKMAPSCYFWALLTYLFLKVHLVKHNKGYSHIICFPEAFRLKENSCKYWHWKAMFLCNTSMQYPLHTRLELFLFHPPKAGKICPWVLKLTEV